MKYDFLSIKFYYNYEDEENFLAFKIFKLITVDYPVSFAIFYLIFVINAQLLCRS